ESSNENDSSKSFWNRSETLLLISSYKEIEKDFTSGKMTQKQCWNKVAQMMQENNINVMDEMFGTKPWVEPLAEAGSNVEIKKNRS
ncbi:hypothetical protein ALC57_02430, partial [Trachymyrmex cornetzi]